LTLAHRKEHHDMHWHPSIIRTASLVALVLFMAPPGTLLGQQAGPDQERTRTTAPGPVDPLMDLLATEAYITPPPAIHDAVLATAEQDLRFGNLDPSGRYFLRTLSGGFPSLERFAQPHLNLGQFQLDPAANRDRRLTTRGSVGFELYSADGTLATTVQVPAGAHVSSPAWAPDGSAIAYFAHFDDATHIYVADAATGASRRLTETPVLATHVTSFSWTEDGDHIVTVLLPPDRGPQPAASSVPETPMVRITTPEPNRLRTYFDLLEDPYEKRLVHYYSTGQLARIDVASGDNDPIGEPAMIDGISPSPDGDHFRVTTMKEELSYIVPTSNVGTKEEIWDAQGTALALLDEEELNESAQGGDDDDDGGNGDPEKRGLTWRRDGTPGLVYLQLEPRARGADADDPDADDADDAQEQEAEEDEDDEPRFDRVMAWRPPFDDASTEVLYQSEDRIQSFDFDESGRTLFLTRRDGDDETVHAVFLDSPDQEYLITEADRDDLYDDPGSLMRDDGFVRTSSDNRFAFLSGTQYFEDPLENAPRPFVDRVEIRTGVTERVFESDPDVYETVNSVLDDDATQLIVSRESPTMVPNQWLVDLAGGTERQLTFNEDRHPLITAARRERLTVTRADGFTSRVTVTLPHDYVEGTALPAMFWFYPREYTEQEQYDEGFERFNKNDFPNVGSRSMALLTLLGYAIVEPDVPIVGPENQRNDEYPHDLRNTLAAVIDEVSDRGWIDRKRLGLGGHSYGAFGTANAMIQTPFFKAGIAGDGNYNRSLTPAGFQSERRMLWEAQDLYIEMSPFFQADRLSGALLMYHGMDDHNVGTHPIHADRMFHALEVLGKTAALYKYPFEDHGPATLETNLDLWARWVAWLELHVKNGAVEEADAQNGRGRHW
jgi:dipeptidyl aminopeptidase/acylaminoacyl peptidase